jgi:hypothetical protein
MVQNIHSIDKKETSQVQSTHQASPDSRKDMTKCGMNHKGIKGLLFMVACCSIPLVILLALPALGIATGGVGASAIGILAVLLCPIGMILMMRMMIREQGTDTAESPGGEPIFLARSMSASSQPLQTAELSILSGDKAGTVTSLPPTNEKEMVNSSSPIDRQGEARPTSAGGGSLTTTLRLS